MRNKLKEAEGYVSSVFSKEMSPRMKKTSSSMTINESSITDEKEVFRKDNGTTVNCFEIGGPSNFTVAVSTQTALGVGLE